VRPQRSVAVDGKHLELFTFEPPPGGDAALEPPILLLHEGLGSAGLWKSFPSLLAERTGRRVIAYSRYGYGRSDVLAEAREPDYMHHEGERVVPELLARLELPRVVLLGHSDGASIALVCAGTHPGLVAALVLEAPHVFVEDRSVAAIEAAAVAYRETDLRHKLARHHDDVDRTFWGWNDVWLDPRFRAWNIESYLPGVRCPTLSIQGDADEYGTLAQLDAISARIRDTQTVVLPGCGHSPHRDRQAETLNATAEFLSALRATASGRTSA
jgi:pimeloyl-ACP methyl ester carboxylesterase